MPVNTEEETRRGHCPAHGAVEGKREVPRLRFPFVVYGVRRMMAKRQPFRCPTCGEVIQPG